MNGYIAPTKWGEWWRVWIVKTPFLCYEFKINRGFSKAAILSEEPKRVKPWRQ
jgi:hypothetical protein